MDKISPIFTLLIISTIISIHSAQNIHSTSKINYIKKLNETHFSCDNDNKVLSLNKFNDDFCDCDDGADENRTNACINGKFYCSNRFYESQVISTSKVNDGFCDCCDGSDEFSLGCPKTCLDLSTIEYDNLMDRFLTLKMIVTNFCEETYKTFFDYNKHLILKIISTYQHLKDLLAKKFLLKSYLNKMELAMAEENENLVDEKGVALKELRGKIDQISEKISVFDKFLIDHESFINSYEVFSIFKDVNEDCLKVKYKDFDCEICSTSLQCNGYKRGNKYRQRFLGYGININITKLYNLIFFFRNFVKFEDNILYFENGGNCFFYNKRFSAKVYIECGSSERIDFKEKINGCHYEFVYTTKIGCNSLKTKELQKRINLLLKEIN